MKVSVIIATYNGVLKIPNLLEALRLQTVQADEIVIVNDGSTDGTSAWLDSIQNENIKVLHQPNGGRAVARNSGAELAIGELLIFYDDDTRPLPNSIALHRTHHQSIVSSLLSGSVPEERNKMQTDFQRYKADLSMSWVSPFHQKTKLEGRNIFLTAANFSIPHTLFNALGGFDPRLRDAEDYDLAIRADRDQHPVFFDPENIAWHDDWLTAKKYIHRLKEYQKAHEKLQALKPHLYKEHSPAKFNPISGMKKWIYYIFANPYWAWTIDHFNWLLLFPRKIRYQLYSIIVTASSVYFPKDTP